MFYSDLSTKGIVINEIITAFIESLSYAWYNFRQFTYIKSFCLYISSRKDNYGFIGKGAESERSQVTYLGNSSKPCECHQILLPGVYV